jgi:hypothetical protein
MVKAGSPTRESPNTFLLILSNTLTLTSLSRENSLRFVDDFHVPSKNRHAVPVRQLGVVPLLYLAATAKNSPLFSKHRTYN